jgi:hypothetical protein
MHMQVKSATKTDDLLNGYFSQIQQYLDLTVDQPLEWKCPETQAADWDNVPVLSAQLILYLCKHGEAFTKYLYEKSLLETTASVR